MAILTGNEILSAIAEDDLSIEVVVKQDSSGGNYESEPIKPEQVQPNSIDLTLGEQVQVYSNFVYGMSRGENWKQQESRILSSCLRFDTPQWEFEGMIGPRSGYPALDSKKEQGTYSFKIDESGWVVKPGILYLMHTRERIHTMRYVTQIDGKSSLARLGVTVHVTAGFGETGFDGQYTLEVHAIHPVILYPGMGIAQAVFHTIEGRPVDYRTKGHYTGKAAMGAQPSRSYKQFGA